MSNAYILLNAANIVLSFVRFVERAHFQPRLGIITRTLAIGWTDIVRCWR